MYGKKIAVVSMVVLGLCGCSSLTPEQQEQIKQETGAAIEQAGEVWNQAQTAIAEEMSKKEEEISRLEEFVSELLPARNKLIDYVKKNGKFVSRSNISESEYYSVKAVDGMLYKVRISSHVYPTGSMTSMLNNTIDTTDYDCREFLKLFGL